MAAGCEIPVSTLQDWKEAGFQYERAMEEHKKGGNEEKIELM